MVSRENRMADRLRLLPRLFGFLLGSTLAGASVYYYILEEYKVSNELLTEDIYVRWPLVSFLGRMELDARYGDRPYTWDTARLLLLAYYPRLCYRKANANPATTGTTSSRATDSLLRDGTGEQDEPDEEMSIMAQIGGATATEPHTVQGEQARKRISIFPFPSGVDLYGFFSGVGTGIQLPMFSTPAS
jgi:hypothetical protein